MFFGIFMVLVYLGMAVLMAINYFNWTNTGVWLAVRWFFVAVLAVYGLYRGYREVKGDHSYGMRRPDLDSDGEQRYSYYDHNNNDNKGQQR